MQQNFKPYMDVATSTMSKLASINMQFMHYMTDTANQVIKTYLEACNVCYQKAAEEAVNAANSGATATAKAAR